MKYKYLVASATHSFRLMSSSNWTKSIINSFTDAIFDRRFDKIRNVEVR